VSGIAPTLSRVFLDATCWVAAAGSPAGGSAEIVRQAQAGKLRLVTTLRVLEEAERNIHRAFELSALLRFYAWLGSLPLEMVDPTTPAEEAAWQKVTVEKDWHVLAGAVKAHADALVTLDRKHLLTPVVLDRCPIPVQDTRQFFQAWRASTAGK
jgi:predicted nucleic acid-binding protein